MEGEGERRRRALDDGVDAGGRSRVVPDEDLSEWPGVVGRIAAVLKGRVCRLEWVPAGEVPALVARRRPAECERMAAGFRWDGESLPVRVRRAGRHLLPG